MKTMIQKTDLSPVDYLKKRIIYYKKKRGQMKNIPNVTRIYKHLQLRYGKQKTDEYIQDAVEQCESRIRQYELAVKKLSRLLVK